MTIWFCTACGTPSGSTADTCPHCGTLRPGVTPPGQAPGAPPGSALAGIPPLPPPGPLPPQGPPPVTGPIPVAQYDVMAPGQAFDGGAQPPNYTLPNTQSPDGPPPHYAPPGHEPQPDPAQPGYDPNNPGYQLPPYHPNNAGYQPPPPHDPNNAGYQPPPPHDPNNAGYQPPPPHDPNNAGYQPPPPYDPNNAGYPAAPGYAPGEVYGPQPTPPGAAPGRRWWVPALVAIVVLLAIGAIATVVLVDRDGDKTAGPDPTPAPTGTTAGPTETPTQSTPSPSQSSSSAPARLVTTDPSVADSRAAGVADMFENYFTSINNRDFDQALTAYDPAGVINPNDSKQVSDFKSAISTTTDSQVVLRSIGPPTSTRPGGVLDARVTFHSNQQPGYGPKERPNEPCTAWDVTYTLSQPSGGGYKILIGKAASSPC